MTASKLLRYATWATAAPLAILLVAALASGPGGVGRAIGIGFCIAPTAMTFLLADWVERIERTMRVRFLPADRGVLTLTWFGIACAVVALAWAALGSMASGTFDLRTATVVLGPVVVGLGLASLSIEAAVQRVTALVAAD